MIAINKNISKLKNISIEIKAENSNLAKEFSQIFTGDIKDISSEQERKYYKFNIKEIDCKTNEVFEVIKVMRYVIDLWIN